MGRGGGGQANQTKTRIFDSGQASVALSQIKDTKLLSFNQQLVLLHSFFLFFIENNFLFYIKKNCKIFLIFKFIKYFIKNKLFLINHLFFTK